MDYYNKIVNTKIPLVMGILNVTPDSFSDGGKYFSFNNAINHADHLINEGADIIDIGGESTRPGADSVSLEEELKRVIPVIQHLKKNYKDIIISIDTTKSIVAEQAIKNGASIVNDISGGNFDANMYNIVSKYDITYIVMHIKGTPSNMQLNPFYENVIDEILNYFNKQIELAKNFGINKLVIDPGIGFGKNVNDNYKILNNLEIFKKFGYPILLGVSKKSFLGKSLDLEINERDIATIITETVGTVKGAKIIRTHNVKNAVQMKNIINFLNESKETVNV